jgi:hypothetical protein
MDRQLLNGRKESLPCISGEGNYGSAAVGGVADLHGFCGGDLYAGSAVVP